MPKKTKQTSFFASARREVRLAKYELLETAGEEKRSKLTIEIPLSDPDKPLVGIPGWIASPLAEMGKSDSLTGRVAIEAMCDGMTLEVFSTDKIKRRTLMSTGVMITGFSLVATGDGDARDIALIATIYVPANVTLHQWAWDHIHKTFFAQFEYSQSEIDWDAKGEDVEEENDETVQSKSDDVPEMEGDDEFSAPAIAARALAKKNGPVAVN
jgi:hypothetical protein